MWQCLPETFYSKSRSQVSLEREFTFKILKTWGGVLLSLNMDTVGTFEMAKALAKKKKIITAIHKHYTIEEWSAF